MYSNKDMVMMKGGEMMMLIGNEMFAMEEDVITSDGILITTDGSIIMPDGTSSRLMEDEAVIVDLVLTRLMQA